MKSIPSIAIALALASQPALSATIFVNASAAPGGDGSTPASALASLADAVTAARGSQGNGPLTIHLAAGVYSLGDSKVDGLLIDVPGLRLEGETQLSFDAAGVPQAVIGGATVITGIAEQALVRVRADGVSFSRLIFDGVSGNWKGNPVGNKGYTLRALVADGGPTFLMSQCVALNSAYGVLVRSASGTIEQSIFGTPAGTGDIGVAVAGGPEASNVSVVFQNNRVEANNFGASFMGDNAAVASLYDPSVDSALHATIAGNEFVGNSVPGLVLAMRENLSFSAIDHTSRLVADVHDNVLRGNAYGAVLHAPQGIFTGNAACTKSPPARIEATFANNDFAGNGLADGHFSFDAVLTDLDVFGSCFVDFSSISVSFPSGSYDYVLGGTGNTLVINGVTQ